MSVPDLPILHRRAIEAEFARAVFASMEARFGQEAARAVLSEAVVRLARESGAAMAAAAPGGPDLDHFRAILRHWTAEDALTIEVLHQDSVRFDFNVTRCRYAEMYRAMGLAELGGTLSCQRDGAFCEGYDPTLTLTRTRTIMGGADHCDFRYRREAAQLAAARPVPEGDV